MSSYNQDQNPDFESRRRPRGRWNDRVEFYDQAGGSPFAFRPEEVLTTRGEEALAYSARRNDSIRRIADFGPFTLLGGIENPVAEAEELLRGGFLAQPNHIFFAHCGGCCPPHPATGCGGSTSANPVYPTPVYPTPVYPTPVYPTPVYPTPVYPTPVYPTPVHATPGSAYRSTGARRSSARPAPFGTPVNTLTALLATPPAGAGPCVVVLDTGLAGAYAPHFGTTAIHPGGPLDTDEPDEDGNGYLDPASGHGTFIAGLVQQVAPGCDVAVHRVLSTFTESDEAGIVDRINSLVFDDPEHTVLSLSFGGYTLQHPHCLAWAIAEVQRLGVVVVASAGNDGTCRPSLPAALPGVVSVGAVGPNGPAPFSNYGPWVRACAPGVDLLSTFFDGYQGGMPAGPDGVDPDEFAGWAIWSGTSFAAPIVAGALCRMMSMTPGCTAQEAVARVIDAPSLMRIPNLGTVVNVI